MTPEKAAAVSEELAIAFLRLAGEMKITSRGIILDALVFLIARTLESHEDPEQRADMRAKMMKVLADDLKANRDSQN